MSLPSCAYCNSDWHHTRPGDRPCDIQRRCYEDRVSSDVKRSLELNAMSFDQQLWSYLAFTYPYPIDINVCIRLLSQGANPNFVYAGRSCLYLAIYNGCSSLVFLLYSYSAVLDDTLVSLIDTNTNSNRCHPLLARWIMVDRLLLADTELKDQSLLKHGWKPLTHQENRAMVIKFIVNRSSSTILLHLLRGLTDEIASSWMDFILACLNHLDFDIHTKIFPHRCQSSYPTSVFADAKYQLGEVILAKDFNNDDEEVIIVDRALSVVTDAKMKPEILFELIGWMIQVSMMNGFQKTIDDYHVRSTSVETYPLLDMSFRPEKIYYLPNGNDC